jgi:hypothetical protein
MIKRDALPARNQSPDQQNGLDTPSKIIRGYSTTNYKLLFTKE